ncbi:MAG: hypothetical protein M9928_08615 [Anaerolineae bacterium]|nr:hypothetical protein [Anaerolineae bacterium]MCO5190841.1 hypothetical protein [Anaerolineae bacterium]MCO5205079.1 hypothetical protein [Anaerolineae bacterium]
MNSATLPSFWKAYGALDEQTRRRAQQAYQLWADNPFHPSLHFKCINSQENIWSARVSLAVRAVGVMDNNTVTWFWIGNHDEYERFFG